MRGFYRCFYGYNDTIRKGLYDKVISGTGHEENRPELDTIKNFTVLWDFPAIS